MAEKVPSAAGSSAIVGDPGLTIPLLPPAGSVARVIPSEDLIHRCYYFADVDVADTWSSGIDSIVSLAWSPDDANSVNAVLLADGVVSLVGSAADSKGWLHVWSRGY